MNEANMDRMGIPKWRSLVFVTGLICVMTLFYFALSPVNRTEAEDAYEYAWRLENQSGLALLDVHHLFYLPLANAVSVITSPVVPPGYSLELLSFISAAATAFMLYFLFRLMHVRLGLCWKDALLAAMVPGVFYGIWRYAAEAEIYGLSGMFAVWLLLLSIKGDGRMGRPVASALVAVAGTCIHVMNILPALAVGIVCLCQRRWRVAVVYGMTFVVVLLAILGGLIALGWDPSGLHGVSSFAYKGSIFSIKSYPRALVGIGTGLLSSQFIFAWEPVSRMVSRLFPGMIIAEESFFGQVFGLRLAILGTVLLAACFLSALWLGIKSITCWKLSGNRRTAATLAAVAGLWFLLYAFIVFRYDPAAPEFWIQALVAIFLIFFSLLAIGGCFPAVRRALLLFFICTLLHNGLAGMLPLKKAEADFNAVRAKPMLEQAGEDDLVLSSGSWTFYQYLRYNSPCDVVYLYAVEDLEILRTQISACRGRVYAFDELGNPPASLKLRYPEAWSKAKEIGMELRDDSCITIVSHANVTNRVDR